MSTTNPIFDISPQKTDQKSEPGQEVNDEIDINSIITFQNVSNEKNEISSAHISQLDDQPILFPGNAENSIEDEYQNSRIEALTPDFQSTADIEGIKLRNLHYEEPEFTSFDTFCFISPTKIKKTKITKLKDFKVFRVLRKLESSDESCDEEKEIPKPAKKIKQIQHSEQKILDEKEKALQSEQETQNAILIEKMKNVFDWEIKRIHEVARIEQTKFQTGLFDKIQKYFLYECYN